jgi:hypothetical protein
MLRLETRLLEKRDMKISGAHICLSTDGLENSLVCVHGGMLSQHLGVIGGIPFEKRGGYYWNPFSKTP